MRPMADTVTLKVGQIVYWDDRDGWRGKIVKINVDGSINVHYDNTEYDEAINPRMFTAEVKNAK